MLRGLSGCYSPALTWAQTEVYATPFVPQSPPIDEIARFPHFLPQNLAISQPSKTNELYIKPAFTLFLTADSLIIPQE
jgi:hypothetical protein